MRKGRLTLWILSGVIIAAVIAAAVLLLPERKTSVQLELGEETEAPGWELCEGWRATCTESGQLYISADVQDVSTVWNKELSLDESWSISTDIYLSNRDNESHCARIVFGDSFENVCFAVTVEFYGELAELRADALINRGSRAEKNGWLDVYPCSEWVNIDVSKPVRLNISHAQEDPIIMLTLSQDGTVLSQGITDTVHQRIFEMSQILGLGTCASSVSFTNVSVEALTE